jgi:ElaB/YqjD/DUF883 family membrane-anchored ribosome-binding protein
METKSTESGKTSTYGTATTPKRTDEPSTRAALNAGEKIVDEVKDKVTDAYDRTRETVTDAYDRTAKSLNEGYGRAVDYGRANPGKTSLIIFGAGLGVGLLLANGLSNGGGRSRRGRIITPVMNALTDISRELFR